MCSARPGRQTGDTLRVTVSALCLAVQRLQRRPQVCQSDTGNDHQYKIITSHGDTKSQFELTPSGPWDVQAAVTHHHARGGPESFFARPHFFF